MNKLNSKKKIRAVLPTENNILMKHTVSSINKMKGKDGIENGSSNYFKIKTYLNAILIRFFIKKIIFLRFIV